MEATETRKLLCILKDDERDARAKKMAQDEIALDKAREEKRAAIAQHNNVISGLLAAVLDGARAVDSGEEIRDVECKWISNFKADKVLLMRSDTGVEVDSRDMTSEDRQIPIPGVEVEPALPSPPPHHGKKKASGGKRPERVKGTRRKATKAR